MSHSRQFTPASKPQIHPANIVTWQRMSVCQRGCRGTGANPSASSVCVCANSWLRLSRLLPSLLLPLVSAAVMGLDCSLVHHGRLPSYFGILFRNLTTSWAESVQWNGTEPLDFRYAASRSMPSTPHIETPYSLISLEVCTSFTYQSKSPSPPPLLTSESRRLDRQTPACRATEPAESIDEIRPSNDVCLHVGRPDAQSKQGLRPGRLLLCRWQHPRPDATIESGTHGGSVEDGRRSCLQWLVFTAIVHHTCTMRQSTLMCTTGSMMLRVASAAAEHDGAVGQG